MTDGEFWWESNEIEMIGRGLHGDDDDDDGGFRVVESWFAGKVNLKHTRSVLWCVQSVIHSNASYTNAYTVVDADWHDRAR